MHRMGQIILWIAGQGAGTFLNLGAKCNAVISA